MLQVDVEEETETEKRYAETKELLIPVLRKVPIKTSIQRLQLMDVLENGIRFAQFRFYFSFLIIIISLLLFTPMISHTFQKTEKIEIRN